MTHRDIKHRIAEAERLHAAATNDADPWRDEPANDPDDSNPEHYLMHRGAAIACYLSPNDAASIVALHNLAPDLFAYVKALEEVVECVQDGCCESFGYSGGVRLKADTEDALARLSALRSGGGS